MPSAKEIRVGPITSKLAHEFVRRHHYSHKSVANSQLHLGISLHDRLVGVMQFGPSLDKRKLVHLVKDTRWNGFIELNRMVCLDESPRNTESRALSIAMRCIRRQYPHVQWVVTFADGTQCGDGTIYRAAGFLLCGLKRNTQIWESPTGARFSRTSLTDGRSHIQQKAALRLSHGNTTKAKNILQTGAASMVQFQEAGFRPLPGFQLRYVYFLDASAQGRLTVPIIPFSRIAALGASMYMGRRQKATSGLSDDQSEGDGATPILTLQSLFPMRDRMRIPRG